MDGEGDSCCPWQGLQERIGVSGKGSQDRGLGIPFISRASEDY